MRVLSLFDGMSCGMIALRNMGVKVDRYVAYEIDSHAVKVSEHNFPEIEHKGDVFKAEYKEGEFDLLMGGSPCTYWSIAQTKNRETVASGMGWELFSQYVRALREAKPKWFLYENNKSMSEAIKNSITETFGFEPICINSALVSAQNRQRLYWCGVRQEDGTYRKADILQPEDRGILLKDILEDTMESKKPFSEGEMNYMFRDHQDQRWSFCNKPGQEDKSKCVVANIAKGVPYNILAEPVNTTTEGKAHTIKAQYYKNSIANFVANGGFFASAAAEKAEGSDKGIPVYEVKDGQIDVNGEKYPIKLNDGFYIIRKLTVGECMRLQTVPDWFDWNVSNTQAYKMLGNGWTVEVIVHLLKGTLNG